MLFSIFPHLTPIFFNSFHVLAQFFKMALTQKHSFLFQAFGQPTALLLDTDEPGTSANYRQRVVVTQFQFSLARV